MKQYDSLLPNDHDITQWLTDKETASGARPSVLQQDSIQVLLNLLEVYKTNNQENLVNDLLGKIGFLETNYANDNMDHILVFRTMLLRDHKVHADKVIASARVLFPHDENWDRQLKS